MVLADVNGDGIADMIIGAPFCSANPEFQTGAVYVIFGGATRKDNTQGSGTHVLSEGTSGLINGVNGYRLHGGHPWQRAGVYVGAGDVNASGIKDVLVGMFYLNGSKGSVSVFYGHIGTHAPTYDLSNLCTGVGC